MAFEWDPAERSAFDEALVDHIVALYPEARPRWTEYARRLTFEFPDGGRVSIWEPNFYFSWPSFPVAELFGRVAAWVANGRAEQLGGHANGQVE